MKNSALTARQRLAMDACTECGQCLRVCPAAQASGDVNLSAEERMRQLKPHRLRKKRRRIPTRR